MLLSITSTRAPAADLGFLLHKHPQRFQSFSLSFGQAHVFYPEAGDERCTAVLLLDVDPVGLVRGRRGPSGEATALQQYVNDRPYVGSSFLSVAIAQVFGTALAGRCERRPELAAEALPLCARLTALPCRGGEPLLRRLFEPLGYGVQARSLPLDESFPDWGESRCLDVTLQGELRLCELLAHLYVLVPVLDDEKHYWVGEAEVDKLLRHGESWLSGHPERALIARRYLRYQGRLTRQALAQLVEEDQPDPDAAAEKAAQQEEAIERPLSLNEQRLTAVLETLKQAQARRVVDLGCGEGKLLRALLGERSFEEVAGMDVSVRSLQLARERLRLDTLPERQQARIRLLHGSLTYRDARIAGYDAATLIEVIEHLDPARLAALEAAVFEAARPATLVLTTPNAEYNVKFESLPAGRFRHRDHRFEWTRAELEAWASGVAGRHGYSVRFAPVGPVDPELGAPTQMAVFQQEPSAT
jgi:3' terminal RNA ribose 2'-O-methyltransferase Hen1